MRFKLAGIGELLWDLLPGGRQPGGAPANFAYHACALGAEAHVVSRIGNDQAGRELMERLAKLGLPTDCIEVDPVAPTGTVSIAVAADGQPQFTIHENVAWDNIRGEESARAAVTAAHAVCFGTLAQRSNISRNAIRTLLKLVPAGALRILDVNLRQHFYSREILEASLALANVLKVNDTELLRLAEMFQLAGDEREQIIELASRFNLRLVACTRGERGSMLFSEGRWSDHSGVPVKIVDTVGAGDAFTAALVLGTLAHWPLDEVNRRASEVAACVCSQAGGTPELPEHLCADFISIAQDSNRRKFCNS